jgi:predicted RNase H-like nuclease
MTQHVGVDGCKAGWIAVTRNGAGLAWRLFRTVNDLASAFLGAERIFIDVPIGLPSPDAPIRACDRLARQVLGKPRKSSVFPVPCREALTAYGVEAARRINRMRIGRSVGAQTWGISSKISEVDCLLLSVRRQAHGIREVHPEICFWALADRRPMRHSKTTVEGRQERLRVLAQYEPGVSALLDDVLSKTLRKYVQADDVLDAAVAFVTAEASRGTLTALAGQPSHDPVGLPIEMLYLRVWDESPKRAGPDGRRAATR